jgi:hypothetical protein
MSESTDIFATHYPRRDSTEAGMTRYAGPALAAIAFHAALLALYVTAKGGDASILVGVADSRVGRIPFEQVQVSLEKDGYDGQYFYAIARNPWRKLERSDGLDCPPLRQARILYPVACWLLSGGYPRLLVWALPAVNLLAIGGLAALGALLAGRQGFSPWWGFSLPLAVCAGLPALRDLSDVLSAAALCSLLIAWLLRGPWWASALAAAAAVFARDPNVAIVGLVLGGVMWRRDTRSALGLVAALLAWAGWMVTVRTMYGTWSFTAVKGDLGAPGRGLWYGITHLGDGSYRLALLNAVCLLGLLVEVGLVVRLFFGRGDRVTVLVALAGVGLALLGDVPVYNDFWGYMRIFNWLPLGCWLACMHARLRVPAIVISAAGFLPIAVVVQAFLKGAS